MPHEDGPSTPFLARIDTGLRSAFGSSRSEAMPDAGPSPGSSLRAEEGSSILEAVRRLQAAEPTTLGVGALTSDVYTEAVVRVLTAKLGAQRPDLGAGAKEVREALSVLKVESEAREATSTAMSAAGEGDEGDVAGGEGGGESGAPCFSENVAPSQSTSHTALSLAYADFTSALRRFAVR